MASNKMRPYLGNVTQVIRKPICSRQQPLYDREKRLCTSLFPYSITLYVGHVLVICSSFLFLAGRTAVPTSLTSFYAAELRFYLNEINTQTDTHTINEAAEDGRRVLIPRPRGKTILLNVVCLDFPKSRLVPPKLPKVSVHLRTFKPVRFLSLSVILLLFHSA